MGLLYFQPLPDCKHLEPSYQKESAKRQILDENTFPHSFAPNAEMKPHLFFEIRLRNCIFEKVHVCFLKSGCSTEFDKKTPFQTETELIFKQIKMQPQTAKCL